ncbi:MAG: DUF11 domain-containing protein [Sphingobacteriales bacterium]|nr:DUF11 domain-containing protein [Sphingobacteriales bacterium]
MKKTIVIISAFCVLFILSIVSACKHDIPEIVDITDTTDNPIDTTDNPIDTTNTNNDTLAIDLKLTKTVSTSTVTVGDNITYTISISNEGDTIATGIKVKDVLPAGLDYVSSVASNGTYSSPIGEWSIGTLTNGSNASLLITAKTTAAGTVVNTVQVVAADQEDKDSTPNNSSSSEDDQASVSVVVNSPVNTDPCSPDSVYFSQQVLPLLLANCAMDACHDAVSPKEGVNLTTYAKVMQTGGVNDFSPLQSELYEVLVEDNPNNVMPPPPYAPLSADQIQLIYKWIAQGALNLTCTPDTDTCPTDNMSFSQDIAPILSSNCGACHSTAAHLGNVILDTYTGVKSKVDEGSLLGAIKHQSGFSAMPPSGTMLPECDITKIEAWINQGALNN